MGLRSFLKSCSRLLKLAKKPSRSELWLSIKICFLGVAAIGGVGYIVLLISMALHGGTPTRA